MKVALFVPCYVDGFFPEVGIATLELLERLGCEVDYPLDQTCCGQPMANSGCHDDARATEALYAKKPQRPDECCGFGGTFSMFEEPVSAKMGYDKVGDHHQVGAEYIVSPDMSCVMHQKGCAQRMGLPLRFIHIAQVLNGARE